MSGVFGLVVLAAVLGAAPLSAQEVSRAAQLGTDTFLQVAGLTEAGPPRVFDNVVVLTYEQPRFTRYVAAAFAHENYGTLHVYAARAREERSDLMYLIVPISPDQRSLEYRIVVDGVWMSDPNAPQQYVDSRGVPIGRIALREPPPYQRVSPDIGVDGTVTFYFSFDLRIAPTLETVDQRQVAAASFRDPVVSIVGTFNGWDPFVHRLTGPDAAGFYSITLPLASGPHYYYFMVDGVRVLDPINRSRAQDVQTGTLVTSVRVP